MIRRPPRSTLFPTRRSSDLDPSAERRARVDCDVHRRLGAVSVDRKVANGDRGVGRVVAEERQDRKSTRLNSSHLVISYAVFCLTKKSLLTYTARGPHRIHDT